jgi:hypothetical protein
MTTNKQLFFALFKVGMIIILLCGSIEAVSKINNYFSTIDNCKSEGWDGAKFVSKYSIKMICSNYTEKEKYEKQLMGGRAK